MRSRYSAFVLGNAEYLLQTWHPSTRPAQLDLAADDSQWLGLKLCACRDGGVDDATGQVEFIARYRQAGRAHRLHETSRFVREPANDTGCCYYRWYYLDGDLHTP